MRWADRSGQRLSIGTVSSFQSRISPNDTDRLTTPWQKKTRDSDSQDDDGGVQCERLSTCDRLRNAAGIESERSIF